MIESRGFAVFLLVVAMVSIQCGATAAKHLFPLIGPEATTALRCFLGALVLFAVWRPWRSRLPRKDLRPILLYGASLGGMNLLFYLSIARIPLGLAVAIEFSGPLAVALLSSRRRVDFIWAILATLGILLILPLSAEATSLDPIGIALALAAGLCWALYILFGQTAGKAMHGGRAVALGMAVAALITAPMGVLTAGTRILNFAIVPLALTIAVFSSALPYTLEMFALKRLPRNAFGILMSLEPAVAALSGVILLDEQLSLRQWVAIGSIMAASAGSSICQSSKKS